MSLGQPGPLCSSSHHFTVLFCSLTQWVVCKPQCRSQVGMADHSGASACLPPAVRPGVWVGAGHDGGGHIGRGPLDGTQVSKCRGQDPGGHKRVSWQMPPSPGSGPRPPPPFWATSTSCYELSRAVLFLLYTLSLIWVKCCLK